MSLQSFLSALVAGVAAFVAVGVAVTELAATRIAFSVFVGLPAGLLAGVLTAAGVYATRGDEDPGRSQRIGWTVVTASTVFLLVFFLVGRLLDLGVVVGVSVAGVAGLLVGVIALVRSGSA